MVITSALHAEGPGFEPQMNLISFSYTSSQDDLDLQAERQFLESTRQSNSFLLSDYYSKAHTMEH